MELLGRALRATVDPEVRERLATGRIRPGSRPIHLPPEFAATDFAIELAHDPAPVPEAVRIHDAATSPAGTRHLRIGDDEFWIFEPDAGAVHGQVGARGTRLALVGRPFAAWFALHFALVEALTASGLLWIHAAAVHDGTRTVALLGPTGRGKSTTLLRLARQGWQPIAEDGCFLDPSTLELVGVDDRVRLRPPALAALGPVLGDVDPGPLVAGRHEVPFARLGGGVASAPLTHVVRLVRTPPGRATAWGPLSRAEAVMALYESIGIPNTIRVGALVGEACREVVRRTRHATLDLGAATDPIPPLVDD